MERREMNYPAHAGLSLKAHYYAPRGAGKFPGVIAVHGGGWRLENRELYRDLGPWLAERGYAVLAVTYRLATPERKAWPEALEGVRAGLKFARSEAKLGIDAARIPPPGDSSGAPLLSLVSVTERPPLKAGVGG